MLLTSAQVSLAVSSGIILLCSVALFLSGYVIQQRTLRDLRAAIKPPPRPSPNIFLPGRFKYPTAELPDGTVVVLNDGQQSQRDYHNDGERSEGGGKHLVVEVKPTRPLAGDDGTSRGQKAVENQVPLVDGQEQHPVEVVKGKGNDRDAGEKGGGEGGTARAPAEADQRADEQEKPISRAERRRRIRAELMRMAQSQQQQKQKLGYYRRRLW